MIDDHFASLIPKEVQPVFSRKTKVFLFLAFVLRVSPLLQLFRHSKVCLLTYYITDVILITIIMAPVIQSAREQLA